MTWVVAAIIVALATLCAVLLGFAYVYYNASRRMRFAEAQFQDAVERRYNLLEAVPDGMYIADEQERITLVNDEAERLLRMTAGELVGRRLEEIVGPLASDVVPDLRRARQSGVPVERTVAFRATETWVELRVQPGARETLVSLRDVTERTRAEVRLRESESRLRLLMGQVPALLWTADRHGFVASATGAGLALIDTGGSSIVGRPVTTAFEHGNAADALAQAYLGMPVVFESSHGGRRLRHDVEALRDDDGAIVGAIGVALDVTEMRNTEQRLTEMARRDTLTGLPNRLGLEESLRGAILDAKNTGGCAAVVFVDLDRFKTINDTLGHRTGDELLRAVAERLQATLGPTDSIARPGGDEFIIVSRTVRDNADVHAVAARIQRRLSDAFTIDGRELFVGASLGGAVYPDHGTSSEQLMKHADVAMYRAKAAGRGTFVMFDSSMQAASLERLGLENDLRQALARNEFEVVYQPLVTRTQRIAGCEALLRWRHPTRSEMSPSQFVALAEEMGVIVDISRWVLAEACAFGAQIRRERPDFRMSVNVSGRDLYDPHLAMHVADILERTGLAPSGLELEVTESVLLDDRAIRSLDKIRALGVRIAVDDFGVSYSVLSCVKRLPISTLKIDRSFIDDIVTSIPDQAIVKAIVALSKALGLRIIAEGVENEEQWRFVTDLEVDEIQGYYIGRPVSKAAFLKAVSGKVVSIERAGRSA